MPRALIVEIFGDAKQFAAELDKAAGKTRQMGRAAGVAGLALAGGLAYGLEKSVKAAMSGQVSQDALNTALKNTHQALAAVKGPLEDAEAAGRKLGFADDDTRVALSKLVTATGDTKKAISDLGLAEDVARFKHTDLDTATKLLTGTLAGNARAAKQLGISLQPVTDNMDALRAKYADLGQAIPPAEAATARMADKQATAAATIQLVSDKLGGQADAYATTTAGGLAQFHAETQHLEETLGKGLLPALTSVATALASGASFLAAHTTVTRIAIGVLASLSAALIAVSVASKLAAAAQAIMTAAQWALNAALDANPIGLVILALAALGVGLVEAYRHSQTFREIVSGSFTAVKGAALAVASAMVELGGIAQRVWTAIEKIVQGASKAISGSIGSIVGDFNSVVGVLRSIESAAEAAYSAAQRVANAPGKAVGGITGAVGKAAGFVGGLIPHASGGSVSAGVGYLVGERGPEMFVSGSSGTIIPNQRLAGAGGGGGVNVYLTVNGWVGSDQQIAGRIRDELTKFGRRDPNIFGRFG